MRVWVCGGVGVGVDVEEVDDGMGGRDGMGMAWGVAVQYSQYSQCSQL